MNDTATDTTPKARRRPGILLSDLDRRYMLIGLDRLATNYEGQSDPDADAAAAAARALMGRLKAYGDDKPGFSQERGRHFQSRMMKASAEGQEAAETVLTEWWMELLQSERDPAGVMAPMLVQLMRGAGNQTAVAVIASVGKKLGALQERHGAGAEALGTLGNWLTDGLGQAQTGAPLWPDDPDLTT